jgi:hypothetical protein
MSVLARVHETVAVAQRWTRVAALAAAVASGAVILAAAALFLGGGRWLALSAVAPFVAWGVAVVVGVVVHRQLGGRWRDAATTHAVAVAAEREHGLRWGVLLGLLQIGGGGGAFARAARGRAGLRARGDAACARDARAAEWRDHHRGSRLTPGA